MPNPEKIMPNPEKLSAKATLTRERKIDE